MVPRVTTQASRRRHGASSRSRTSSHRRRARGRRWRPPQASRALMMCRPQAASGGGGCPSGRPARTDKDGGPVGASCGCTWSGAADLRGRRWRPPGCSREPTHAGGPSSGAHRRHANQGRLAGAGQCVRPDDRRDGPVRPEHRVGSRPARTHHPGGGNRTTPIATSRSSSSRSRRPPRGRARTRAAPWPSPAGRCPWSRTP